MRTSPLSLSLALAGLLMSGQAPFAEEAQPVQEPDDKKVYRKFHTDGVVEFSDQPTKGSEELKVEELPTYKFTPAQSGSAATPTRRPSTKAPEAQQGSPYSALGITSPSQDETLRANSGDVEVKLSLTPPLQTALGHQIEYLLDGKSVLRSSQAAPLNNLDRGTHTLVVQVVDANNKVLIHSDAVSFHIQRYFAPPK